MPICLDLALASNNLRRDSPLVGEWSRDKTLCSHQGCVGAGRCDLGRDLISDTLAWAVPIKRSLSAQSGLHTGQLPVPSCSLAWCVSHPRGHVLGDLKQVTGPLWGASAFPLKSFPFVLSSLP